MEAKKNQCCHFKTSSLEIVSYIAIDNQDSLQCSTSNIKVEAKDVIILKGSTRENSDQGSRK